MNILSKKILFPYAAWTAIAAWLNPAALLIERKIVTSEGLNIAINLFLFGAILSVTLYFFKKSNFSSWYGAVLLWATAGIIAANLSLGSVLFAVLAGAYAAVVVFACYKNESRNSEI